MNKIEMVKGAAGLVVSLGVGAICKNAIKMTTPSNVKRLEKLAIGIGGFALGGMVADKAVEYTEKEIDKTVQSLKDIIGKATAKVVNMEEKEEA